MAAILVIDDDPTIRMLVRLTLEDAGHNVEEAGSAADGLSVVKAGMPDLILLDLVMPEMDGWRFLDELRSRGLRNRTRIVIISGNADERSRERGRKAGAFDFVAKPFDPNALVRTVEQALSQSLADLLSERERTVELAVLIDTLNALGASEQADESPSLQAQPQGDLSRRS